MSCILFMPGVSVDDNSITYTSKINPSLFNRVCVFCKTREGATVFCNSRSCRTCFHILCGRIHNCALGWSEVKRCTSVFCEKHSGKTYSFTSCEICHKAKDDDHLLLCDGCDKGFHTYCLQPPLKSIPKGDWFCSSCIQERVKDGQVVIAQNDKNEEQVTVLSTTYIEELAKVQSEKRSLKEKEKDDDDEDDDDDEEDDEGVSFYETKRIKKTTSKKQAKKQEVEEEEEEDFENVLKKTQAVRNYPSFWLME